MAQLDCWDVVSNRDEDNKQRDQIEESQGQKKNERDVEDVTYDDKPQELVKVAIAFKTLQLLGQGTSQFYGLA
jgi:hypothetical protein